MKSFTSVLSTSILLLCTSLGAHADTASEEQAEILLDSMQMETLMQQSIDQMLNAQMQQNPGLEPFRDIMVNFLNKHMSYENIKPDMVKIYGDAFTADELKEMNAFYQTPTGKKAIEKLPELMARGSQLGAQRVQDNIQELQQQIQAEAAKLQQEQGQAQPAAPVEGQ